MKILIVVLFALLMTGCATLQNGDYRAQLPVQYATMKLIEESDSINSEGVIAAVNRTRSLMEVDAELELGFLADNVRSSIDWQSLAPSDRLLINALISEIEAALDRRYDIEGQLPEDAKIRLSTLLDYIEEAAHMTR